MSQALRALCDRMNAMHKVLERTVDPGERRRITDEYNQLVYAFRDACEQAHRNYCASIGMTVEQHSVAKQKADIARILEMERKERERERQEHAKRAAVVDLTLQAPFKKIKFY